MRNTVVRGVVGNAPGMRFFSWTATILGTTVAIASATGSPETEPGLDHVYASCVFLADGCWTIVVDVDWTLI